MHPKTYTLHATGHDDKRGAHLQELMGRSAPDRPERHDNGAAYSFQKAHAEPHFVAADFEAALSDLRSFRLP